MSKSLTKLLADVLRYDADLKYRELTPTADDYNAVVGFVKAAIWQEDHSLDQVEHVGPSSPIDGGVRPRISTLEADIRVIDNQTIPNLAKRLERIEVKLWPQERKRNWFVGNDGTTTNTLGVRSHANAIIRSHNK